MRNFRTKLVVFVKDSTPIDTVYLDWKELISENPDTINLGLLCCFFYCFMLLFVPASHADTCTIPMVSHHRCTPPVVPFFRTNLLLNCCSDSSWLNLAPLAFINS